MAGERTAEADCRFTKRSVEVLRPVERVCIKDGGLYEIDRFDRGDRVDQLVWDTEADSMFIGYGFEGFGAVAGDEDVWAYLGVDSYDNKRDAMRRWCKYVEEATR